MRKASFQYRYIMVPIQQRLKLYKISHWQHSQDIFPFTYISKNVSVSLTILIWGAWHQMYISSGKKYPKCKPLLKRKTNSKYVTLAPASGLSAKRGGNFTVWFYTHDSSIRNQTRAWGWVLQGWEVDDMWVSPVQAWLPVCLGLLPNSRQKVPGRTSRATCSPGMKSRQLNNTASGCGRASLGRKHFGLSILFQSSVSDYFLFQIRTLHTPPQHHLPCLTDECSQDVPRCHLATLSSGRKMIVCTPCP